MIHVVRKPVFCICQNKGADQMRGNRGADQCLCFLYKVQSLYFLNPNFQACLCWTWTETPKTGFVVTRLMSFKFRVCDMSNLVLQLDSGLHNHKTNKLACVSSKQLVDRASQSERFLHSKRFSILSEGLSEDFD